METASLNRMFSHIGARLKATNRPVRLSSGAISLDVQTDRKGVFFEIAQLLDNKAEIAVLEVQPADHHLLLPVREGKAGTGF